MSWWGYEFQFTESRYLKGLQSGHRPFTDIDFAPRASYNIYFFLLLWKLQNYHNKRINHFSEHYRMPRGQNHHGCRIRKTAYVAVSLHRKRCWASEVLFIACERRFWWRENWGESKKVKEGSEGTLAGTILKNPIADAWGFWFVRHGYVDWQLYQHFTCMIWKK